MSTASSAVNESTISEEKGVGPDGEFQLTASERESLEADVGQLLGARIAVLCLLIGCTAGAEHVFEVQAAHFDGPELSEAVLGVIQTFESLTPIVAGILVDNFGLEILMLTLPVLDIIASVVALTARRKGAVAVTYILYSIGGQAVHICAYIMLVRWFCKAGRWNSLPVALCLMYELVPLVMRVESIGEAVTDVDSVPYHLRLNVVLNCCSYLCFIAVTVISVRAQKKIDAVYGVRRLESNRWVSHDVDDDGEKRKLLDSAGDGGKTSYYEGG